MTIIGHDPGHGAPPAVIGVQANGIVERDYVFRLAMDIAAGVPGYNHQMLRTGQVGLLDYLRADAAKQRGCQLVLCHHVNEDADPASHGLIAFYSPDDAIGQQVAEAISDVAPQQLLRTSGYRTFAARPDDWTSRALWVIHHYRGVGMPCVLIEWGFASHASDAAYLLAPENRPALLSCVEVGLARYTELTAGELACKETP